MTDPRQHALLPAGLGDSLPPEAGFAVAAVERMMAAFASHGFERVEPPLIEFEDSLLAGSGAAMASQTFRVMDPVSQRMMALRPDMTLQVARIARTRLGHWPRPLRLSYAGPVLRVRGSQRRPERQFGQVGVELIGSAAPAADAEVILMALDALGEIGIEGLTVDLGLPTLVPGLCRALALEGEAEAKLRAAFDRKDAAAVTAAGARHADLLCGLLAAAGPAEDALARLDALALPATVRAESAQLASVARQVRAAAPALALTVDPVEHRGYEYHTGVTYTFFAAGAGGEIGRGGRYRVGEGADAEPATGLTLFADTLIGILPKGAPGRRVFVPLGTPPADARRLRAEGWVTVAGLAPGNADEDARRQRCEAVLEKGRARPLGGPKSGRS